MHSPIITPHMYDFAQQLSELEVDGEMWRFISVISFRLIAREEFQHGHRYTVPYLIPTQTELLPVFEDCTRCTADSYRFLLYEASANMCYKVALNTEETLLSDTHLALLNLAEQDLGPHYFRHKLNLLIS